MQNIFRVVSVGVPQVIEKNDGTECVKQQLVLREQGSQYADSYAVTWFGMEAIPIGPGMCIAASIRMRVKEGVYSAGGEQEPEKRFYQDAVLQEYACLML